MPNWCSNYLRVSGSADRVAAFRKKAHGHTASYNSISSYDAKPWEVFDDIRKKAIILSMPEPGEVSELSFHALHPVPDLIRQLGFDSGLAKEAAKLIGVEYPGQSGYDWQCANWGTKWEPDVSHVYAEDNYLEYEFCTAWSPPTALLDHLTKEWPDLLFEIEFREEGMGFYGRATYSGGECTDYIEGEIKYEDEDEYGEEE